MIGSLAPGLMLMAGLAGASSASAQSAMAAGPATGAAAASSPASVAVTAADDPSHQAMVFLGIRILKVAGAGPVAYEVALPPHCPRCALVPGPYAAGQNDRELFFHLWVPAGEQTHGPFRIALDPAKVRGILASYTDLAMSKRGYATDQARRIGLARIDYRKAAGSILFAVPAKLDGVSMPPDDLGDVSQNYTYIETPGVYIRIGHADPARRAGPYATGPWPARQAAAALNLEFAARAAIEALALVPSLPGLGVKTIMLMNFDTNYPTLGPQEAHEDWPPHWHMHLYWNDVPRVRTVGHFYLSEAGLLTGDFSNELRGSSFTERAKHWIANGTANETRTPSGDLVYAQTITPEGFFKLATAAGACLIEPAGAGFDSGAIVRCDRGAPPIRVRAVDDPAAGTLLLYRDDRLDTEYRYDRDTGALIAARRPG